MRVRVIRFGFTFVSEYDFYFILAILTMPIWLNFPHIAVAARRDSTTNMSYACTELRR